MVFRGGTGVIVVSSVELIASLLRQTSAVSLFGRNIDVINVLCVYGVDSYDFDWNGDQRRFI